MVRRSTAGARMREPAEEKGPSGAKVWRWGGRVDGDMMSRERWEAGRMSGRQAKEGGKTDREKRGNYCSVNGIQSNFLLLKKSFIYVDSLLVMYWSVTPPLPTLPCTHSHFPPSHPQCVRTCVSLFVCCCVPLCVWWGCIAFSSREGEVGLNCTDKINM